MMDAGFQKTMCEVVQALKECGLDPIAQLEGYLRTGNSIYITQHQNARTKIRTMDRIEIERYLAAVYEGKINIDLDVSL